MSFGPGFGPPVSFTPQGDMMPFIMNDRGDVTPFHTFNSQGDVVPFHPDSVTPQGDISPFHSPTPSGGYLNHPGSTEAPRDYYAESARAKIAINQPTKPLATPPIIPRFNIEATRLAPRKKPIATELDEFHKDYYVETDSSVIAKARLAGFATDLAVNPRVNTRKRSKPISRQATIKTDKYYKDHYVETDPLVIAQARLAGFTSMEQPIKRPVGTYRMKGSEISRN